MGRKGNRMEYKSTDINWCHRWWDLSWIEKKKEIWNETTHRKGIGDLGGTAKMVINIEKVIEQQNFVQRK